MRTYADMSYQMLVGMVRLGRLVSCAYSIARQIRTVITEASY